jgi:dolichyl-phosphate beta-glucosyltransferase
MQTIEGWGFDAELLFLADTLGLNVKEVPVVWSDAEGTRIHPLRDGLRMMAEVFTIRWKAISGEYSRDKS